jgi:hypothetical protein
MITRYLLIAIAIFAFSLSACSGPENAMKSDEKTKDESPQESDPPPKKTKAELLVGKWKLIVSDNETLGFGTNITEEYTKSGKFIFKSIHLRRGEVDESTGSYELVGDTLRLVENPGPNGPGKRWEVVIESLTETEFVTIAGPANQRERSISKRIEQKSN